MKPKIHLICNAHLDPVWQWQWEEGAAEAVSTFRNAVDILKEHNGLIFNHNEAVLYDWIRQYDPVLFKEIQELVKQERWSISGGWWLQPDVNIPGTESLIRQISEGRKFFKEYFNAVPTTAYNFDSFGHSGGLPQLLVKAGYKMYVHMRPQHPELQLPSNIYRWQGVDGSTIGVVRIEVGLYHTEFDNLKERLEEGVRLAVELNRDVPVFWGIGDHGGGATRKDLKIIDEFIKNEERVEIIHSTTDLLYESLKEELENAPVVKGDLQRVFTGCYTSLSRIKRGSQKSLGTLTQAESLATAAWWKYNTDYPAGKFTSVWRDHLFNDFHDILPGTCIEPAETDALNLYGKIETEARRIKLQAAASFNNNGEPVKTYIPVTIMNNSPALKRVPVEVECMISHRPKWSGEWYLKLNDPDGNEIECQEEQPEALLPFNGWRRKISFMADLPSVGVKNYNIEALEGKKDKKIFNPVLIFSVDESTGLVNKITTGNKNIISGNLFNPLVVEDKADSWGTGQWEFRSITGEFIPVENSFNIKEEGPVRRITESELEYGNSKIINHVTAYSDWDVLEIKMRVIWNEEQSRLKLSIPTIFKEEYILCEVPGGMIERPADGQEHVHGRWFIIGNEKEALAVIHNGQFGIDCRDGEARLSVLRSAAYCHEQGFKLNKNRYYKFSDIGVHECRFFVICGTKKELLERITSLADHMAAPPVVYSHFLFRKNKQDELLTLPAYLRMLALKRSSDGTAIILRVQEITGNKYSGKIIFDNTAMELVFNPLEIKTLRIEKNRKWKEVDMIWER